MENDFHRQARTYRCLRFSCTGPPGPLAYTCWLHCARALGQIMLASLTLRSYKAFKDVSHILRNSILEHTAQNTSNVAQRFHWKASSIPTQNCMIRGHLKNSYSVSYREYITIIITCLRALLSQYFSACSEGPIDRPTCLGADGGHRLCRRRCIFVRRYNSSPSPLSIMPFFAFLRCGGHSSSGRRQRRGESAFDARSSCSSAVPFRSNDCPSAARCSEKGTGFLGVPALSFFGSKESPAPASDDSNAVDMRSKALQAAVARENEEVPEPAKKPQSDESSCIPVPSVNTTLQQTVELGEIRGVWKLQVCILACTYYRVSPFFVHTPSSIFHYSGLQSTLVASCL